MIMALKVTISAIIILAVNVLAKRYPFIGGWVAALPIVSLLSAGWLLFDKTPNTQLADFLQGVLVGLIPTAIMLFVIVYSLRNGINFIPSLFIGICVWLLYTWSARLIST
jgi:F0F1-type ATP synthase assembly protein I